MIVADANIVAYLHIAGAHTAGAQAVFARDAIWLAPPLWREEFVNILVQQCRLAGMSVAVAEKILTQAAGLMTPHETAVEAGRVLRLAVAEKISGYDAHYVALAQKLRLPLVTEDRELLRKFPGVAVSLAGFASV